MPMASSSINQVEPTIDSFLACWTLLSARVVVVTGEAAASNEHLLQQLDFWREKDIDVQLRKLDESGDEDTEAAPNTDDANVHAAEGYEQTPKSTGLCSSKGRHPGAVTPCARHGAVPYGATAEVLEASLAELMRSSEEMMGRVDEQHRHERELAAKLEAVEALSAAQAREEGLLRRKLEEARAPALDAPRLAPAASSDSEHRRSELTQLKAQDVVEDLRRCAAEWSQENSSMEARLGRLREKAAEDLERAVRTRLFSPNGRLVTLLVKSTCLRRSFALHLLATCKRDRGGVLEVNKTWLAIQIDSDVLCHDGNFRHFFCIWARDQHGLGTPAMSKCAPQTREREHHREGESEGVNIKGFAFSEITGAVILIGPWGILASVEAAMTYMLKHGGYWWDERCFVLKVMSKFMAGMFGFFAIGVALSHVFRFTTASLAGSRNTEFLKLVERTEGAFQSGDDTAVEDSEQPGTVEDVSCDGAATDSTEEVRRILAEVRVQYDQVHLESERREAEIAKLREQIRVADRSHGYGADESTKKEDSCHAINKQFEETTRALVEAKTSKKVYTHMCERITKEQALLKEKLLLMEAHLQRKSAESQRKVAVQERLVRKGAQCSQDLDILEQDVEHERVVREDALAKMASCLQAKIEAGERRKKFEEWRHEARDERVPEFQEFAAGPTRSSGRETDDVDRNRGEGDGVALDAANEAFNASAGRLRKLYAVEKLAGNCLQKVTFEQVERSQNTEDGFQKIREVTGLADVMDIVHKFLNRDVEHEQLKSSVKEAEMRLDTLREQFERFKRDTDGITFDTDTSGKSRAIYLEVEEHEAKLNLCQKEHEQSRDKLQQSTLQVEHMKRWANRMGRSLSMFEDCVRVEKPSDLPVFYQQMQRAVDKFIAHIVQQISSGKARASCAVATGD
ncbi:unnamed protein product [Durusdinium trenchii]|uniref:Uncharacterized protein n=1 Tax=Durusdinium trenchii TaxID=1381693 RepID=A0ABP0ILZ5_9DINO